MDASRTTLMTQVLCTISRSISYIKLNLDTHREPSKNMPIIESF